MRHWNEAGETGREVGKQDIAFRVLLAGMFGNAPHFSLALGPQDGDREFRERAWAQVSPGEQLWDSALGVRGTQGLCVFL